ncbi:hypothetical protein K488DRAFT_76959 [Vararia minispora EC-137]|uniref:Uncharacterized protein n=1 Tax=Vararia minispora EC-137 TaxID=1314806 RepID=A0ACB8QTC9_9AGAM|nr:hypothetical protein K488DRAFT_76959 [Vararia minispora EC-137]
MFPPKPGCPMCGIVAQAPRHTHPVEAPVSSPSTSGPPVPEILWRDNDFTAYREKTNAVSSKAHVVIVFNLHVPSLYLLSSSDLPLLVRIRDLATRLLTSFLPASSPLLTATTTPGTSQPPHLPRPSNFCIGFITSPFYDTKIPVTDHLHAHAYILPADKLGFFRGVAYSGIAWYDIDDLIAEIRESVSNNRVKSGHANRKNAPIERVPDAGARAGTANGLETTAETLAARDPQADAENGRPSTSSSHASLTSPTRSSTRRPELEHEPPPFAAADVE